MGRDQSLLVRISKTVDAVSHLGSRCEMVDLPWCTGRGRKKKDCLSRRTQASPGIALVVRLAGLCEPRAKVTSISRVETMKPLLNECMMFAFS